MNKNATPIILIVLSIGIYFTFTRAKIEDLKAIRTVNADYETAIKDSENLIKSLNEVQASYDSISPDNQDRLQKIIPTTLDNVRAIVDINGIAARYGFAMKTVKVNSAGDAASNARSADPQSTEAKNGYNTSTLSFTLTTTYQNFVSFMRDLEQSLRIVDISKISVKAPDDKTKDTGKYDFSLDMKTYWLQ